MILEDHVIMEEQVLLEDHSVLEGQDVLKENSYIFACKTLRTIVFVFKLDGVGPVGNITSKNFRSLALTVWE